MAISERESIRENTITPAQKEQRTSSFASGRIESSGRPYVPGRSVNPGENLFAGTKERGIFAYNTEPGKKPERDLSRLDMLTIADVVYQQLQKGEKVNLTGTVKDGKLVIEKHPPTPQPPQKP